MNKVSKFAMKISYLILRKIVKIVATKDQILRRKCIKFDFGGVPLQTPMGSLQHSSGPIAGF